MNTKFILSVHHSPIVSASRKYMCTMVSNLITQNHTQNIFFRVTKKKASQTLEPRVLLSELRYIS